MAMRLTGLMSGMDTESVIQELVSARRTKVDTTVKAQTKLEWKQEAWKSLNTKLKNLMTKYAGNMRFTSSYSQKTTKVSNESAASVITGENAVNGVQELEVNKLAKTAYLTGGKINYSGDKDIDAMLTLEDLGYTGSGTIDVTVGGETKSIEIDGTKTISDVLTGLKDAGLNASFDAKNQRFFVSAKESGAENDFTIGGDDAALSALGLKSVTKEEWDSYTDEQKAENQGLGIKIAGQDSEITLNGATFTSSTNVFEINGLAITALNETKDGESITLTTQDDVDGIYDMVKDFFKEYNSIINEMDELYNADSAKGYEPLTDDEKEAMSESEIEKYEEKIKSALLRRDSNLSTISSALKGIMSSGVEVNGETMYLSDFGINTLGYFNAPDNEKNAYHIDGDPDDSNTSGNADVLKGMISSDPNTVITFFSELSKKLYSKMDDLSKSVNGYRSYGNFYDDKKMKEDYDDYTTKIAELEEKLADYEDQWYAKFAAMETAMAKMQSNMNAVTSMLGG